MAASELLEPLPPPTGAMWSSIGVTAGTELHGGFQSRVFAADRNGDAVVVKLTDSRLVGDAFYRRIDMTASLAAIDESVIGPLGARSDRVMKLGGWLTVVSPFATGRTPDVTDETDVRRMADTLARLHRSLDRLGTVDLPPVAALADIDLPNGPAGFSRSQLLHGDFSDANVLFSNRGEAVIDFDDCGYGPIEFEVGNTLYMVLFDAATSSSMDRYRRFRQWFVDAYRSASDCEVADDLVDRSIRLRVEALGRWLDNPDTAPIFIRTSTAAWHRSLRAFVRSHGLN